MQSKKLKNMFNFFLNMGSGYVSEDIVNDTKGNLDIQMTKLFDLITLDYLLSKANCLV